MLDDAGSIASLAGLAVSLGGLAIAIWQIKKLRGETRAANEAAAETRRALQREVAGINLTRVNERIDGLKELHRRGEWDRALDRYTEIRRTLIDVRFRHPGLSEEQRETIATVVAGLRRIENAVESKRGIGSPERVEQLIRRLTQCQTSLAEIESQSHEAT